MIEIEELKKDYISFRDDVEQKTREYEGGGYRVEYSDLQSPWNDPRITDSDPNYLVICEFVKLMKDVYEHPFIKKIIKFANGYNVQFFDLCSIYGLDIGCLGYLYYRERKNIDCFSTLTFERRVHFDNWDWTYLSHLHLLDIKRKEENRLTVTLREWVWIQNGLQSIIAISKEKPSP